MVLRRLDLPLVGRSCQALVPSALGCMDKKHHGDVSADIGAGTRKSAANRRAYLGERLARDRVLLRLDKGLAARMDAARAASGLSRSAFASLHLGLAIDAMGNREASAAPGVGDEFDLMFPIAEG